MIIFRTFSDGDNSETACPIYCNVFYSESIWRSIQNCSYVWQKKNTECNSVKGKFALIFCQAWVSVKTYLMKFCQTLVVTLTVLSKSTVAIGLPIFIFQYVNNNKIIFQFLTNPFITIDLLLVPYRQFRSFRHNSSAMSQQLNKMSTQTCLRLPFIEQFLSTDKIKNEISSSLSQPFYCLQACQDVFQDLSSCQLIKPPFSPHHILPNWS